MNTIQHPDQFRYWPEYRCFAHSEEEARTQRETRQRRWAYHTKSGYEAMEQYYQEHPEHRDNFPSAAKRGQYAAACAILVTQTILK